MHRVLLLLIGVLALASVAVASGSTQAQPRSNYAKPAGTIAYVADSLICVVSANGSGSRCMSRGYDPIWSADGRQIAYWMSTDSHAALSGGQVFVMNADGTAMRQLTARGGPYGAAPAWSPLGPRIAFERAVSNWHIAIYVTNADGTGLRRLVEDGTVPAWSPDGRQIAFVRPRAGYGSEGYIYVMNADGSHVKRLTRRPTDAQPVFSPNGKMLLFERGDDLWVMKADGTGQRRLARNGGSGSWSPDSRRIVFTCVSTDRSNICAVNADGSGYRRLTSKGYSNYFPALSPNGQWIAFERYSTEDSLPGLYVMDADGSAARQIVPDIFDVQPTWQPTPPSGTLKR